MLDGIRGRCFCRNAASRSSSQLAPRGITDTKSAREPSGVRTAIHPWSTLKCSHVRRRESVSALLSSRTALRSLLSSSKNAHSAVSDGIMRGFIRTLRLRGWTHCNHYVERRKGSPIIADSSGAVGRLRLLSGAGREVLPNDQVRDLATQMLDKYSLRAADSMQLAASASLVRATAATQDFHCGDRRLALAASAEAKDLRSTCRKPFALPRPFTATKTQVAAWAWLFSSVASTGCSGCGGSGTGS